MSWRLRLLRIWIRLFQLILTCLFTLLLWGRVRWLSRLFRFAVNVLEGFLPLFTAPFLRLSNVGGVRREEEVIAGVRVTWFVPHNLTHPDKMVFYIHGGFLFLGSLITYGHMTTALAATLGCPVAFIHYSLAPEYAFPVALHQLRAVYAHLSQGRFQPANMIFGGDSAGGGLTLSLLMMLRDEGFALPAAGFAESGLFDLTISGKSIQENWFNECFLPSLGWFTPWFAKRLYTLYYAAGQDLASPYLSPLFGSLRGLPPCHLACSRHEMLFDDTPRMIEKARVEGWEVTPFLSSWTLHVNAAFLNLYPEAQEGFVALTGFIRSKLKIK